MIYMDFLTIRNASAVQKKHERQNCLLDSDVQHQA